MASNRKTKRLARRLYRLSVVGGAVDAGRARQITQRLAASERRGSLQVAGDFLRLVRLDLERHTATVESAAPLADDLRGDVAASLAKTYGAGVDPSFAVNPALIGGMRVKVGSDVYDGSVRGRLAAIEARF
jgi:F-type H+-transporting ATPase subunit delta